MHDINNGDRSRDDTTITADTELVEAALARPRSAK